MSTHCMFCRCQFTKKDRNHIGTRWINTLVTQGRYRARSASIVSIGSLWSRGPVPQPTQGNIVCMHPLMLQQRPHFFPIGNRTVRLARCLRTHSLSRTKFYLKEVSLHASLSPLVLCSVDYIFPSSLDSEVPLLNSERLPDLAWVPLPRCQPPNSTKAVTWASQ